LLVLYQQWDRNGLMVCAIVHSPVFSREAAEMDFRWFLNHPESEEHNRVGCEGHAFPSQVVGGSLSVTLKSPDVPELHGEERVAPRVYSTGLEGRKMRIPINGSWLKPRDFHFALLLTLTSGAIPRLSAAPVITGVVNAASYADPLLPRSLIATGGIFVVTGTGLGPANISIAPAAFQSTSLSGTSVKVTVNGKTVDALMYYTSATQVAALIPSSTPTGGFGSANPNAQVTITVTYNGEDSAPTSFQGVVLTNLGLFTLDSSGSGPAIVTFPITVWYQPCQAQIAADQARHAAPRMRAIP